MFYVSLYVPRFTFHVPSSIYDPDAVGRLQLFSLVFCMGNALYLDWSIYAALAAQRHQLYTMRLAEQNQKPIPLRRCASGPPLCLPATTRGVMRVLVISDSHGNYASAFRAHQLAGPVDHIIHLGDGCEDARLMEEVLEVPVLRVAGNCDLDTRLPTEMTLELGECRILATHGNRQRVKSGLLELMRRGTEAGATVVLYGHTHLPKVDWVDGMLLVNPGALKEGMPGSYAVVTWNGATASAEIFPL